MSDRYLELVYDDYTQRIGIHDLVKEIRIWVQGMDKLNPEMVRQVAHFDIPKGLTEGVDSK